MQKSLKVGVGAVSTAVALLGAVAQPAFADLAPSSNDVVGVGSDTVQYAVDFVADGDFLGDAGYNANKRNRIVNFDATADANARFAYGPGGLGSTTAALCGPGTGSTAGTGNNTAPTAQAPCGLNPTIVLRAGLAPIQRPNGSGSGAKALKADTNGLIGFSRASSAQLGNLSTAYDSITIGTDPLKMLQATTSNAVALSNQQLKLIYACDPSARTWNQVGGTSTDTIVPLLPQIGSGTRSSFLSTIGNPTLGPCVQNVEENDPEAVGQVYTAVSTTGTAGSGSNQLSVASLGSGAGSSVVVGQLVNATGIPAGTTVTAVDAGTSVVTLSTSTTAAVSGAVNFTAQSADVIEPMSGGRLNLFQGLLGDGSSNGVGGYFHDPSCGLQNTTGNCASSTLAPAVKFTTGTPSDSNAIFGVNRPLYLYFRHADINSTKKFQPGGTLNWVRTLFYNPCDGFIAGACDPTSTYGPGGAPYFATSAGQALISAAGITPSYAYTLSGP